MVGASLSPAIPPLLKDDMLINGIEIANPIPKEANSYVGAVLVLGGGKTVWEDYEKAKAMCQNYDIMCVNDIGCQFKAEKIHHAVSLHKGILPAVRLMRKEKSMLEEIKTHCHKYGPGIDCIWPITNVGGTSGLFAVKVAMVLGYSKILVCGTPIDGTGHYFDPYDPYINNTTSFANSSSISVWSSFKENCPDKMVAKRVRSFSGRTKEVLGEPTIEWLRS